MLRFSRKAGVTAQDYAVRQKWIYQLWRGGQMTREECLDMLQKFQPFTRHDTEDLAVSQILSIESAYREAF